MLGFIHKLPVNQLAAVLAFFGFSRVGLKPTVWCPFWKCSVFLQLSAKEG